MRRSVRTIVAASLGCVLLIGAARMWAAEKGEGNPMKAMPTKAEHMMHQAYLGVAVEPVYPGLVKHLPKMFQKGQGLLVVAVAADSPAEKAGIKPHDILMSYEDQKLFAPQQLLGLVHNDKAGNQVMLTILHEDKSEQVKATLGSHDVKCAMSGMQGRSGEMGYGQMPMRMGRWPHWWSGRRWMSPETNVKEKETSKETFDSMTLQNLGKDRFKVEIQYLDANDKLEKHKFEGTKEEIHHAIMAQKDLPSTERAQLLRSLDMPYEEFDFPKVSWRFGPLMDWGFDRADGIF